MAQLPMDKIHPAMDMPHLLLKDTVLATVTPILPHHMDTALPATAPLFMDMNLLMAQLPMDKIHLAMDMPHLLLKDTVLATVTPILPHHMDTPMDTVLPATAPFFYGHESPYGSATYGQNTPNHGYATPPSQGHSPSYSYTYTTPSYGHSYGHSTPSHSTFIYGHESPYGSATYGQ